MKKLLILVVALSIGAVASGFGRSGGMGLHHSRQSGGAFGSSGATPGTNSLGTALSSGRTGRRMKGPPLGTGNAAVDREDKHVAKIVHSICRGC